MPPADGLRNAKTGRYDGISTAYRMKLSQAYVVDPPTPMAIPILYGDVVARMAYDHSKAAMVKGTETHLVQPVPADTGSSTAGGNSAVSSSNDPTNVKLKVSWTKDQLKSAPDFQYYKAPSRTTERPTASPTTGMAPRPATPGAER